MDWVELTINVNTSDLEIASAIATSSSDGGLYIEDYSDMLETLPSVGYYDYIDEKLLNKDTSRAKIHIYYHEGQPAAEAKLLLSERLTAAGVPFVFAEKIVHESEYANAWKKHFHPVRIGNNLIIRPSWEDYAPQENDLVLTLDPEMAFGTGDHETTRLCLEELEKLIKGGERLLDMGCGSGILSVAGLMFGASEAYAVDIDPNAVAIARKNAEVNGFSEKSYSVFAGNASADSELEARLGGNYDVIAANIVADVIKAQASMYYEKLKSGGKLVASGIIDVRKDEVTKALTDAGFEIESLRELRGWVVVVAVKH